YRPAVASIVLDRHGDVIGQYFVQRRRLVRIDDVPKHVIDAFVASEDGHFFEHGGIDFTAILRAALANLRAGRIEQGASTITQQLVKNMLLTSDRTWSRKLREVALALEVERRLSKEEILLTYLNQIYLGNGSYGVGDAARSYFGKDVAELDLSEAALLAGLPQRPSAYSPVRYPDAAEARRQYVLARMLDRGSITPEAHAAARLQRPVVQARVQGLKAPAYAAHFIEEVRRELVERFGALRLYRGGFVIETTQDLALQRAAYESIRSGLEAHDRRQGWRGAPRTVAHADWNAEIARFGRVGRWTEERELADIADGTTHWPGLVIGVATDARKKEIAWVGLAPGVVVYVEVDPAAWGVRPAAEGPETRILAVGDVASFRLDEVEGAVVAKLAQEPLAEGALLSIDVASGDVLAMVGGYDFGRSEFNRAIQARRQPGSAFKPFVYAAAVESGYTQSTQVLDSPNFYYDESTQSTWRPRNYGRRFLGWLTMRRALTKSANNAAVHIASRVGVDRVVDMARRLGVRSDMRADLSLALGTSEVSLLELTRAYAVFPAGGKPVHTRFIRRVLDRDGKVVFDDAADALAERGFATEVEAVSPQVARVMTDLLHGTVADPGATGRRANSLGRTVAGKTGTTNGNRDAWFVGFSPEIATGVWVGFDRPRSLGARETGGRAALPIWVDYMGEALADRPERGFSMPEGVVFARIDRRSGKLAASLGPKAEWQAYVAGTEPVRTAWRKPKKSDLRRQLMLDAF
ncbi:MAG: PBP1A family penicillin-binding protein, partial [Deltaproteobacteria bacterium]|nr:PBP1A family penicillin-binding protein [Deltaproteobacteria bacterium]